MREDSPVVTFGLWLRRWRQALGLSRPELAQRVGCSRPMIRQIEEDMNRPSATLAVRLAAALGVPLDAQGRVVACARGQLSAATLPLPSLAVAMAAPSPSSGHMPHPATPLVGRDLELATLIKHLTRHSTRLVTLTGLTGVGKTHLARSAAVAVQFRFDHGAWLVELSGAVSPTAAARTIAHALGVADYGTRPVEAQLAIALARRTMLLVLDDLDPAPPVTGIVKGLLAAAARLTVLATSSRPLGLPGETVVPILPLAIPRAGPPLPPGELASVPAAALFTERAQAVAPGFALTGATAPAITGISRQLGGLPLAIELAAARLQVLSLDELAASIERDADAVLTLAPSPAGGYRGLHVTLEGAWASLPDNQRQALDRLAIFPAGCDRAAAEAIAGATIDDLTSLITAGLLRREADGRFVLHDLVRRIAARRLAQAGEDLATARRYARHYAQLAEEAAPELPGVARDPWLTRLAAEDAHLQAAFSWAVGHEPPLALRMAAALPWYWYFRGAFGQGRSWIEQALATAPGADMLVSARAQAGAGALAWAQGDHAAARAWLEGAIAGLRAGPDQRTLVHALAILTLTAHDQGDHHAAVSWAQDGTATGRAQLDAWSLALALTAEGAAQFGAGDLEGAETALTESLEIWAGLRESWGLAMALLNRGRVAFIRNEHAAASTYLEEGLDCLQHARDRRFSAAALLLLGEIARRQGGLPLAQARLAASINAYQEVGADWGVSLCLEGLAATEAEAGQPGQAARLLGAANAVQAPGAASRSPDEAAALAHLAAGLQSALGEENYRAHWTAGHTLTAEQAIAELATRAAETTDRHRTQTPH
jgi:predicted ATPase/transcriptional regulator with XRE-family HTH domain